MVGMGGGFRVSVRFPVSGVPDLTSIDLGRLGYEAAYAEQCRRVAEVEAGRASGGLARGGFLLTVEHDPVITVSRRAGAATHLLATPAQLEAAGVKVAETDRGGDITYHGPGQLVMYPILDINLYNLGVHDYMRLLEDAVIDTCGTFGLAVGREQGATGVWTAREPRAKVCAMGVRFRRWVSMHGLAINVRTNLSHFGLIVPCGLVGRGVTSLERELGESCPSMDRVREVLDGALRARLSEAWRVAREKRANASATSEPRGR
ncbi:MAG: lipoyl(octanoyl) transferase LipB [Leptolyngbya sp. PLA1]|nr:lipoyl(octanoyl) transferase LipB [Leptolyngbya sp. PLA1]